MHLHHRFIVAGVRIIFKQEKHAKRERRAMNKGIRCGKKDVALSPTLKI